MSEIKFRNGDRMLTLWPEKTYDDGWVVGWCPELGNNIAVNPENIACCERFVPDSLAPPGDGGNYPPNE